jgi:hypothetical protein
VPIRRIADRAGIVEIKKVHLTNAKAAGWGNNPNGPLRRASQPRIR